MNNFKVINHEKLVSFQIVNESSEEQEVEIIYENGRSSIHLIGPYSIYVSGFLNTPVYINFINYKDTKDINDTNDTKHIKSVKKTIFSDDE